MSVYDISVKANYLFWMMIKWSKCSWSQTYMTVDRSNGCWLKLKPGPANIFVSRYSTYRLIDANLTTATSARFHDLFAIMVLVPRAVQCWRRLFFNRSFNVWSIWQGSERKLSGCKELRQCCYLPDNFGTIRIRFEMNHRKRLFWAFV